MTKKRRILKTVLLSFFIPIVLIVAVILTWMFFPIGINPSNMIGKFNPDGDNIEFNDKVYVNINDSKLTLAVQESGLIFKEELPINEVYKSRFKHFPRPVDINYFMIGDKIIIGHCKGAFYGRLFKFIDKELYIPELKVENIKKIEKCQGECGEYFETSITGTSDFCYYSATFNDNPPENSNVYKHHLTVLETYSESKAIQLLLDLFTKKQEQKQSDDIKNGPERFLYKIEFADKTFPFYLIVVR